MTEPDIWGIVLAAGTGSRFGGRKQHVEIAGRTLWQWAASALRAAGVDNLAVVGPVAGGIDGGPRRRDSVAAGLAAVPDHVTYVAVHDAARPLAPPDMIRRLVDLIRTSNADGVVPGLAVADTIKRVDADGTVIATVDRSDLVAVQTPQLFRAASLREAHAADASDATDDAALIERWGGVVRVAEGDPANLKITYPIDLALAVAVIADRAGA